MPAWTNEQQRVIDTRNHNILVSAAAGSGKTAVLVERIIQKITDQAHPVDVDRLLVVTFTRAAAQEMKERIRSSLNEEILAAGSEERRSRLERQKTLLSHAKITTIDSFCKYIVSNHFDEIGLDPTFRQYDENEMRLLEQEVMDDFLEEEYQKADPAFLELVKTYGTKNSDAEIAEMILQIKKVSDSFPWPEEWIAKSGRAYQVSSKEDILKSAWMKEFVLSIRHLVQDAKILCEELVDFALSEDGIAKSDKKVYSSDFEVLRSYEKIKDDFLFLRSLHKADFISFSGAVSKDPELKILGQEARNARNSYKEAISKVEELVDNSGDDLLADIIAVRPHIEELIALTLDYLKRLNERKTEENVLDFSDIEHAALRILVNPDGSRRSVAVEFASAYDEIMVDEYQDSNDVQEAILSSITKEEDGGHDYFMVGDVKQSIYRFRQARPQIFMEKLNRFSDDLKDSDYKILLGKNFRSRQEVIDCVNAVFRRVMGQDLGKVEYDESHYLNLGNADYPASPGNLNQPELILGYNDSKKVLEEAISDDEFEAYLVADRIRRLLDHGKVYDAKQKEYRKVEPRDIAILCRSLRKVAPVIHDALEARKIPSYIMNKSGYYNSNEVENVLSYLEVLENPLQDIPMAAVLHSKLFHLSEDDLAEIVIEYEEESFGQAVLDYARDHAAEEMDPVVLFYREYDALRKLMHDIPLHEVILHILKTNGYQDYIRSMPGGQVRAANLDKLVDLAIDFEHSGGVGVVSFVDYIHRLKEFDVDEGDAELLGEDANCVKIMTIHKSKGLEFPIVFLSGIKDRFSGKASRKNLLVSADYGLSLAKVTGRFKVKSKCLYDKAVLYLMNKEDLGEELRVLYVAMTRAKEKLIFTGIISKDDYDKLQIGTHRDRLTYAERSLAKSYYDWLKLGLGDDSNVAYDVYETNSFEEGQKFDKESESIVYENVKELLKEKGSFQEILKKNLEVKSEDKDKDQVHLKGKYSVSELKHQAMILRFENDEKVEESGRPSFLETREFHKTVPAFISGKDEDYVNPGALRGIAMHRAMELLDFQADLSDLDGVKKELDRMLSSGRMTGSEYELLSANRILEFCKSDIFSRMKTADFSGLLHRESPFVMGEDATKLFDGLSENHTDDGMILIQGIIDAWFIEDGQAVLVDYKTDSVKDGQALILRYQKQMELYGSAIQKATQMPIKESILYSFHLGEVVPLD